MPAEIKIVNMYTKVKDIPDAYVVDTTSKAGIWAGLSPFTLGPCALYEHPDTREKLTALNMENAWQYAKLYSKHCDENKKPTEEYWKWARTGWGTQAPHRYPMGRGAKPEGSWWVVNGQFRLLGYIEARKRIYAPLYAEAVKKQHAWTELKALYQSEKLLVLRDYDGYDHVNLGMDLTEVLNFPARKMGHAFVLKMLLTNHDALKQLDLRPE